MGDNILLESPHSLLISVETLMVGRANPIRSVGIPGNLAWQLWDLGKGSQAVKCSLAFICEVGPEVQTIPRTQGALAVHASTILRWRRGGGQWQGTTKIAGHGV